MWRRLTPGLCWLILSLCRRLCGICKEEAFKDLGSVGHRARQPQLYAPQRASYRGADKPVCMCWATATAVIKWCCHEQCLISWDISSDVHTSKKTFFFFFAFAQMHSHTHTHRDVHTHVQTHTYTRTYTQCMQICNNASCAYLKSSDTTRQYKKKKKTWTIYLLWPHVWMNAKPPPSW